MSVEIPMLRIASISAPRPILFSGNQEGSLGGEDLPIPRMGDRFAVDVSTAQLRQDAETRRLLASLIEATTGDATMLLFVPNATRQLVASPVVDGSGQTGSTLNVRGLFRQTVLRRGDFFSIVHSGRRYVHMIRAEMVTDANGAAAVPIWPMLRFITVDGEACEFASPRIEGRLLGFDGKGAVFTRNRVEPMQFSIMERA